MKTVVRRLKAVWQFYYEGFRSMTWGRLLWLIIGLKLAVMFLILRPFFFRPALAGQTEAQRVQTVGDHLTRSACGESAGTGGDGTGTRSDTVGAGRHAR